MARHPSWVAEELVSLSFNEFPQRSSCSSVTITGVCFTEDVASICGSLGLHEHTLNYFSLGVKQGCTPGP